MSREHICRSRSGEIDLDEIELVSGVSELTASIAVQWTAEIDGETGSVGHEVEAITVQSVWHGEAQLEMSAISLEAISERIWEEYQRRHSALGKRIDDAISSELED
jgi:hypothetical protein